MAHPSRVPHKATPAFRHLRHGADAGAANMAVDEAIARAVAGGLVPPTVRFYAWDPACISLGRHQRLAEIDREACAAHGYDVVRRSTGGRAVLHADELTYSVVASPDDPLMAGSVLDAYLRISRGLIAGLRRLGVEAEATPGGSRVGPNRSAACFDAPSAYEILAGRRKILGSAQARRQGSVLQHGALPLAGDVARVVDCLAFADPRQRERLRAALRARATTLAEAAGREVGFEEAAAALAAGIADVLGIDLVDGELTDQEQAWASELARDRDALASWTARASGDQQMRPPS